MNRRALIGTFHRWGLLGRPDPPARTARGWATAPQSADGRAPDRSGWGPAPEHGVRQFSRCDAGERAVNHPIPGPAYLGLFSRLNIPGHLVDDHRHEYGRNASINYNCGYASNRAARYRRVSRSSPAPTRRSRDPDESPLDWAREDEHRPTPQGPVSISPRL